MLNPPCGGLQLALTTFSSPCVYRPLLTSGGGADFSPPWIWADPASALTTEKAVEAMSGTGIFWRLPFGMPVLRMFPLGNQVPCCETSKPHEEADDWALWLTVPAGLPADSQHRLPCTAVGPLEMFLLIWDPGCPQSQSNHTEQKNHPAVPSQQNQETR